MKERKNLHQKTDEVRLVDSNYNYECDWLIEFSNNKLSGNNLASELVESMSFFFF